MSNREYTITPVWTDGTKGQGSRIASATMAHYLGREWSRDDSDVLYAYVTSPDGYVTAYRTGGVTDPDIMALRAASIH